jgi:hypothetical protein
MGIGASIFLLALGAILTFAVNYQVAGIDINVVGIILMVVGIIGLLMFLVVWGPRSRTRTTTVGPVEERRVYDDRPPPPVV